MSDMWNELEAEDKVEYEEMAKQKRVEYQEKMYAYEQENPDKARKSTKDANSPKRPTKETGYRLFCEQNREMVAEENPDMTPAEVGKLLAEKWAELKKDHPDEEAKFEAEAEEANADFAERLAAFIEEHGDFLKLSEAEQKKADDPEHYEMNPDTGRYRLKAKEPSPKPKPKTAADKKKKAAARRRRSPLRRSPRSPRRTRTMRRR